MLKIQRIPMAILLMLSIATISLAGTITGGRTSTSRTGTIVGGRTGTIVGGRTGTIVGGRVGIIPTEADQGFRGNVQDDFLAQLTLLITRLAW